MIAAIKRCERAFDVMVKTEEGIMVVKKTLLQLAQVSSQEGGHQTTFSGFLKVNSGIPGRCKCYYYYYYYYYYYIYNTPILGVVMTIHVESTSLRLFSILQLL